MKLQEERGDRLWGVAGLGREVARGPQTLQTSRRLSLLRFIGTLRAGPCTSLSASLSLSPSWCTHRSPARLIYSCTSVLKVDRQWSKRCRWRMCLVLSAYAVVCILLLLCVYLCCPVMTGDVFVLFDFIRDLYKCLAFWGRYRQTQGRTGRQALRQVSFRLDETCSKPHISLALLSYWTLRLSSLHRALWIQPQSEERESLGTWLIFANNIASVDGNDWITLFWDAFVMFTWAVLLYCNYWCDKRHSLGCLRLARNIATQIRLICDDMCNHECESCQFQTTVKLISFGGSAL